MYSQIDTILRELGCAGRSQVVIFLLLCLNYFQISFNHLVMAFYGSKVSFYCDTFSHENSSYQHSNLTVLINDIVSQRSSNDVLHNVGYNYSDKTMTTPGLNMNVQSVIDSCNRNGVSVMAAMDMINGTLTELYETCATDWQYLGNGKHINIITEWDLICERSYLSKLATTIYFCGVMLGGLVYGFLSDRFGRKPLLLSSLYLPIVIGVVIAYSQNYVMFVVLRFIQGFLMQGLQTTTYVLLMEYSIPENRSITGAVIEIIWALGIMSLSGIAYFLDSWRHIQLAISLPGIVTVSYIWLIPESIRWLYLKKRYSEVDNIIKTIARFNRVNVTAKLDVVKDQFEHGTDAGTRTYTVMDLVRTPILFRRSLSLFYIWMVSALVYYGLTFNITNLAGNHKLNFFISGVVELPAYIAAIFILQRFGRRIPLCVYFFLGGIPGIIAGVIPEGESDSVLERLTTALAVFGKFGMAGVFSVIFLYASELYPTVIRNVGIGACAFFLRLGVVLAPQILMLSNKYPIIAFGSLAITAGLVTLLLPETLHTKLPDTIEEVETVHTRESVVETGDVMIPVLQDEGV